jgi:hypothetical protein
MTEYEKTKVRVDAHEYSYSYWVKEDRATPGIKCYSGDENEPRNEDISQLQSKEKYQC